LTGGARDLPARQQALRAAIAWSHDLLDDVEQRWFRRLAVFEGGWAPEAAHAVCAADAKPEIDLLDSITTLLDKSLVMRLQPAGAEPRFTMLETIREYAWEQLEASGEAPGARRRHAAYFLALAEAAEPNLGGPDQQRWLDRLEEEHDNLRAALAWCRCTLERCQSSEAGEPEAAAPNLDLATEACLRLASALAWFWWVRGHVTEGRHWLERMLACGTAASLATRAKALAASGTLARDEWDRVHAAELLEEALTLARGLGDRRLVADTLRQLGCLAADAGDAAGARSRCEESLAVARELGDRREIARSLHYTAIVAHQGGAHASAEALYDECVSLFSEVGDDHYLAWSLFGLANVLRDRGNYDRAVALHDRVVSLAQDLGHDDLVAWARYGMGFVAAITGREGHAGPQLRESLILFRGVDNQRGIAWSLHGLAMVAGARSDDDRATRLFGAAEATRERLRMPWWPAQHAHFEQKLAAAKRALGEETFAAAWIEGRAMSLQEAITYALESVGPT
jgi:tetratricopeptide (TPR) repeat protein